MKVSGKAKKQKVANFFLAVITITALFLPTIALAQVDPTGINTTIPTQRQQNTAASSQVRQQFNPNASIQGGNTFNGVQFSGVGGAIAGCLNIGGAITKGLNKLFSKAKTGTGQSVPVTDADAIAEEKAANQRENCLNGVAYAVAKGLLQQVTNKALNWVNTGFNGNPLYVRDIDSYLKTVSDQQVNNFLQRIPDQNPIFGNAIRSIITEQVTGIRDGYVDKVMDTPQARAYQAFQEDFSNGGWEAFLNPQNNALRAVLESSDKLANNIATQSNNIQQELQRNNGFLDMKKCVEYRTDAIQNSQTPATALSGRDLSQPSVSTASTLPRTAGNINGTSPATALQGRDLSKPSGLVGSDDTCLRYETVTPGSLIYSRIAEVTTSDVRQLEQADQINEVLGAFFDQLLNRLFSFGLNSLGSKKPAYTYNGLGSNVVIGSNGQPIASSASNGASALGYRSSDGGYAVSDFDISRPQHLRAVLQAQYDYLSHLQDARVALGKITPTLGALDYCIPGPNPTWKDSLNDNAETYFGSLQEPQRNTPTFTRILQSIPLLGGLFGNGGSHALVSIDVPLFDKATNNNVTISDTAYHENNRSTEAIFNNIQLRYKEVTDFYEANYTKQKISDAFASVDTNTAFARGFVDDAFDETAQLPAYAAASTELNDAYSTAESDTRNAIRELESIRSEVNGIVTNAKARYIREQRAAGTPVNELCLSNAYVINTSAITPAPRQESDAVSPFSARTLEANTFFYSQL